MRWSLGALIILGLTLVVVGVLQDSRICFEPDELCYKITLADSEEERAQGLMNVTNLAADAGMLFDFGAPTDAKFWMKNTLIPLRAVWIDASGKVLGSTVMIPCPPVEISCPVYPAPAPVRWVLEISSTATAPEDSTRMKWKNRLADIVSYDQ